MIGLTAPEILHKHEELFFGPSLDAHLYLFLAFIWSSLTFANLSVLDVPFAACMGTAMQ
jgi:hypothetical protein